jgi:dihydroorotate dehydrogenase electron transfer subunit
MAQRVIRRIISQEEICLNHFKMAIDAPKIVQQAKPGQFLHLKGAANLKSVDPLLRRPISINQIDHDKGEITIIYRAMGRGTKLLAQLKSEDRLDIMGPLGTGFSIPKDAQKILVVGGGMGIAPLLPLVEELVALDKEVIILLGAENKEQLLNLVDYQQLGVELKVATVDGSYGQQGFVTLFLAQIIDDIDYLYTCGPEPMIKAIQSWAIKREIQGEVSLEERMGCGTGACLSCVCKVKVGTKADWEYKKSCSEGPIFSLTEVVFDE